MGNTETVNSKLDDALDRAFDIHDEAADVETTAEPDVVAETEEEAQYVADATESPEPEAQEEGKERDEKGRFLAKSQEPSPQKKAAQAAPSPELEAAPTATPQVAPPQFWQGEHKALWEKVPDETKAAILHYEQLRNNYVNEVGNKYANLQRQNAELNQVLEPYTPKLKRQGLSAAQTVDKLLSWQTDLESPDRETRIGTVNELISSMGLNPYDLLGEQGAIPGQQTQYNPITGVVEDLKSEIQTLRDEIAGREQEVKEQALANEYNSWLAEADQSGKSLRPMAQFFEPQMAQLIPHLRQQVPGRTTRAYLQAAYDAVLEHAGLAGQKPAVVPQQIASVKQRAQAANAAAVSPKPSPAVSGMKAKAKNLDEALDIAFAQHIK